MNEKAKQMSYDQGYCKSEKYHRKDMKLSDFTENKKI